MMGRLLRTTEARVLVLGYGIVAVACAFLPLADHLGFEFAAVLTLASALLAPFVGFAAMRLERAADPAEWRPARAAAIAGLFAAAALVIPALIILLNGVRHPPCDPVSGAIWMLLLPAPTAWLTATFGALVRLRIDRAWLSFIVVAAVELVAVVVTVAATLLGPAVFAMDHFGGYLPGPLYDVVIPVSTALVSFRVATVLWGAVALTVAGALASGARETR